MKTLSLLALIIAYVLTMLGVGYWSGRRVKSIGDFMLGGRTVGPWLNAFAYAASVFMPWVFVGLASTLGWHYGLKAVWAGLAIALIGVALPWLALAGRAREMSARVNAVTLPEFFGARFQCLGTQGVASVITVFFSLLLAAGVYAGLATLAGTALNLRQGEILIFLTLLSTLTLAMGGYFDLAVGGFLRGVIQFFGILILLVVFTRDQGALVGVWKTLAASPTTTALFAPTAFHLTPELYLFCLVLVLGVGMWGMPHLVQKFFAMCRRADVPIATSVSGVFALLLAFCIFFMGAVTRIYFTDHTVNVPTLMNNMLTLFDTGWIPLLALAVVFSAAMNVLSSVLLVAAGGVVIDLGGVIVQRQIRAHAAIKTLRITVFVMAGLSVLLAFLLAERLEGLLMLSWCALAGAFVMPFTFSLFWKRTSKMGVIMGMLLGMSTALVLIATWGMTFAPFAGTIALAVSFVVTPLVSLFTKAPSPERVNAAFHDVAILPKNRGTDLVFGDLHE